MTIGWWFILILVLCLLVSLYVGIYHFRRIKSLRDYYVAGHGASPLLVAGSWAATWISGGAMVGIVAIVYQVGYAVVMTWVFAIWVLPITFWFVAGKARHYSEKWSAMTWCEMVGRRYESDFLRGLMACCIVLFIFFSMVAQLKIGGVVFEVAGTVSYTYGVILSTLVLTLFVGLGGMWSCLWNETFLCILMAIAIGLTFLVGLANVGWFSGLDQTLAHDPVGVKMAATAGFPKGSNLLVNLLTSSKALDLRPGLGEFCLLGTLGWGFALALGSSALPHQASRFLAVQRLDKPVFKKLVLFTTVFIIILSLSIYFGLFGRALFGAEFLKKADYVSPTLMVRILPAPLAGLALTTIIFAIVTTVATFLHVISTTVSRDLLQGVIWKKAPEATILLVTRIITFATGLLAMILAITRPPELMMLFHYLVNTGLGFTFFFALVIGFQWRRATKWGAIISTCAVLLGTIYLRFVLNWPQGPLFFWMFITCAVLFVGVSLVTRTPGAQLLADVFPEEKTPTGMSADV